MWQQNQRAAMIGIIIGRMSSIECIRPEEVTEIAWVAMSDHTTTASGIDGYSFLVISLHDTELHRIGELVSSCIVAINQHCPSDTTRYQSSFVNETRNL